jgi:hypothetical protein
MIAVLGMTRGAGMQEPDAWCIIKIDIGNTICFGSILLPAILFHILITFYADLFNLFVGIYRFYGLLCSTTARYCAQYSGLMVLRGSYIGRICHYGVLYSTI